MYMCPALLYQIERRLCIVHYDELEDLARNKNASTENKDKIGASGRCLFHSGTGVYLIVGKLQCYFGTKFLNKFDLDVSVQE